MMTSFYSKGVFVTDRIEIIKNYFISDFTLDLLSLVPFLTINMMPENEIPGFWYLLRVLFLLRFVKVPRLISRLENMATIKEKYLLYLDLVKLFVHFFLVGHIEACLYHVKP